LPPDSFTVLLHGSVASVLEGPIYEVFNTSLFFHFAGMRKVFSNGTATIFFYVCQKLWQPAEMVPISSAVTGGFMQGKLLLKDELTQGRK